VQVYKSVICDGLFQILIGLRISISPLENVKYQRSGIVLISLINHNLKFNSISVIVKSIFVQKLAQSEAKIFFKIIR